MTTDLNSGAPYIFTRGPLEVAIRATCAFPGLFKPVEHEGRLLADGCIVSPVPTAVAARMNARCVLSVAVGSSLKYASSGRKVVHISDRMKGSHRSSVEPCCAGQADLLLEPDVQRIDWNDFSRVDEARAAGADAMRRALPQVRKLLEGPSQLQRLAGGSGGAESRVGL